MRDRGRPVAVFAFCAACVAIVAFGVFAKFSALAVWDDAYINVRYASNLLASGTLSWQPGGAPTYGMTSVGFVLVVAAVRAVVEDPAIVALVSSTACGLAFLVVMPWVIARWRGGDETARQASLIVTLFSLAFAGNALSDHATSGMDTLCAMTYVAAYIALAHEAEREPARSKGVWLGLLGGLAWAVRPDLVLYAVAVPAALAWRARGARRECAIAMAAATALVLAIELVSAAAYFGSPLPLSFYAKSTDLYGATMREAYRMAPLVQLGVFLASFPLVALIVVGDVLHAPRRFWARSGALDRALAVATVAFVGYHLLFVIPIMGHSARFYHPVLPALLWLASRALARGFGRDPIAAALGSRSLGLVLAGLLLATAPGILAVARHHNAVLGAARPLDPLGAYRVESASRNWFRLDAVSALPDDLVLATTEVGLPAALNPGKTVIDLSGLNEPEIARDGFDVDRILLRLRPDLVYMPQAHYREAIERLEASVLFRERYEYFRAAEIGAAMGVALRRDGRHYASLRAIVTGTFSERRLRTTS